ncbi:MAG TPA: glycosyltransferase [Thermoanaerobacterales bacterium]|nr:glycosyltransferase [Thermoanaerobacterales bacterium]
MIKGLCSIIVLTCNQLEYTKKCLNSVRIYTDVPYEIIIVDNGSTDGTVDFLEKQNDITLVKNDKNLGFAKGCNQGIKISKGEFIVLLNNDTIVTKNWLRNLVDFMNNHEDAGIVGPVTNNVSGMQKINVDLKTIDDIHKFADKYNNSDLRYKKVMRLVGFCMMIRRQLLDEIGLLDENFGIGNFEDDDICIRTILNGKSLYMLESTFIYHYGSVTFRGNNLNYKKIMEDNMKYFLTKWGFSSGYYRNYNSIIMTKIPIRTNRVLDIECGLGALGLELRNLNKDIEVHGIEKNENVAKIASKILDKVYIGDAEQIVNELEENYYDVVALGDVLEHMHNPWEFIKKIKRLLSKNGIIVTSIPNINNISIIKGLLSGKWEYADAGLLDRTHIRFFTYNSIKKMFDDAGYYIKDVTKLVSGIESSRDNTFLYYLDNIAKILGYSYNYKNEGDAYQYVIVAAKKVPSTLSLCLITKDEEKNIARCINSVKDIVDEIVVVDTGSKDKTVEIAESFGAKIIHVKWEDDFAKARNIAIENAKSDWILFLDADEEIKKEDVGKIRPLLNDDTVEAYILKFVSFLGTNINNKVTEENYNFRLFRNNGRLRYIYPIHENLRNVEKGEVPVYKKADVTILHYGYLLETIIRKEKSQRNISIISRYLLEHPEDKFQHGNLAVEYFNIGEYHKALKHLLIATKGMDVKTNGATRLLRYLILTYSALKDYDMALRIIRDAKEYYADVPDFKFFEGTIYMDQKRYEKAIEMFKECLSMGEYKGIFVTMGGTGSYRARYMIGLCYEKLNRLNDAIKEYIELLKENPNYQEVFIKLFDIFVKNEKPEDVKEFFDKYVGKSSPVNFAILARLYMNVGRFDIAKEYLDNISIDVEGLNNLKGLAYMGMKDYENAVKHFEMEYGKAKEEALYHEVLCHIISKNIDKAKELLWKIPDSSDKKLYMAIIGDIKAKYDEVKDSFFQLLDTLIKIKEFDLYNDVLNLYVLQFAREDFERYGQLMINYGLEELAMEAYIKAAGLHSQNPEVYRYLAQKAMDKNMLDEALSFAARAYEIDKMDVDNYALIYKIYRAMDKNDEAEEVNLTVKELYPEIDLAEMVI